MKVGAGFRTRELGGAPFAHNTLCMKGASAGGRYVGAMEGSFRGFGADLLFHARKEVEYMAGLFAVHCCDFSAGRKLGTKRIDLSVRKH